MPAGLMAGSSTAAVTQCGMPAYRHKCPQQRLSGLLLLLLCADRMAGWLYPCMPIHALATLPCPSTWTLGTYRSAKLARSSCS